jgi:hypothetical protein
MSGQARGREVRTKGRPGVAGPSTPRGRLRLEPHDPLTSLVLTMPVFVIYHLGLLFTDLRNGADLVTGLMLAVLERSVGGYVALTLGVALVIVLVGRHLRASHHVELRALAPVLGESLGWSLLLLVTVGWLTAQIFGAAWAVTPNDPLAPLLQLGPRTLGPIERVVMAAGAGFHEEVVFRVGLFAGSAHALERAGWSTVRAGVAAALGSAVVFSAVHYVGALGDALTLPSFAFRFFMGVAFAALYRFRGFAVAVYTHFVYDLLVFFVFGR